MNEHGKCRKWASVAFLSKLPAFWFSNHLGQTTGAVCLGEQSLKELLLNYTEIFPRVMDPYSPNIHITKTWLGSDFPAPPPTKVCSKELCYGDQLRWRIVPFSCVLSCSAVSDSFCNPMDCSPPGSSVHGILQARRLEWVAMPSSRGSSPPRDQTPISRVSCIGRQILYHFTTWEAFLYYKTLNSA